MKKLKIFNDPVYGFISIPSGIHMHLIDHPYVQRLRRIKQLGMTHYVYPGALHTRFHHALGAYHLMQQTIEVLRQKGVEITDEEAEAVGSAILLHDIGHGPFSHALENTLVSIHHETISELIMERLNVELDGGLTLALKIYRGEYKKQFLHQLVSGQLDMDRMDYLKRDSFFTGVAEGVIGHDRIIKMLNVIDDKLVVEIKGLYSIEKFLLARRLMYWQVYLHKTVLAAEHMLILSLKRVRQLALEGIEIPLHGPMKHIIRQNVDRSNFEKAFLPEFLQLDDIDIMAAIKSFSNVSDPVLNILSNGIINRRLFRCVLQTEPFEGSNKNRITNTISKNFNLSEKDAAMLLIEGSESNYAYSLDKGEINMLLKDGQVVLLSEVTENVQDFKALKKYFLCYPKIEIAE